MLRPARVLAATFVTFGLVACAVGVQSENALDIDRTEPGPDASYEPQPAIPPKADPAGGPDASVASALVDGGGSANDDAGTPGVAVKPAQGEVLLSEVMYDASGAEPATEWVEVHNATSSPRTLSGLTLVDGAGRTHTIAAGVVLAAGRYALLVRNRSAALGAKIPQSAILYEYGAGVLDNAGVLLTNGATGSVKLRDGSTDIAEAAYGSWFSTNGGQSVQLDALGYAQSKSKSSWCLSANAWATGSEKGTPGAPSDCP